jgi:hypothetical protein
MHASGDAIVAGVAAGLPDWVQDQVRRILDAWGRADADVRATALKAATMAGAETAERVTGDLSALFALDPAEQSATPLEIVRTAFAEPTAILETAGVPAIVRDAFDERAWPGDCYGLVPRTLAEVALGPAADDLGGHLLAWGLAKAKVLRARAARG